MRTSVKAALAGVAGAGLLLGGAGSLAYWNDTETENGGTIESGTLNLLDQKCSGWVVDGSVTVPKETEDLLGSFLIVPGTKLAKTCTFDIKVAGVLKAELSVDEPDVDVSTLGNELTVTPAFRILTSTGLASTGDVVAVTAGTGTWSFDQEDSGKKLEAVITVELPFDGDPIATGDQVDNASNSLVGDGTNAALKAVLDDLSVTVTQMS